MRSADSGQIVQSIPARKRSRKRPRRLRVGREGPPVTVGRARRPGVVRVGKVSYKLHSPALAQDLWDVQSDGRTWEHVYFLQNLEPVNIPYSDFNACIGYSSKFAVQGFRVLDPTLSERALAALPELQRP